MNQTGTHGTKIDPTIGERLMVIRRRRGMSQRELAIRAEMSPTTLNRLERGMQCITAEKLGTCAGCWTCPAITFSTYDRENG